MSEIAILMGFIVVAVIFVWISVKKTTTKKVNNQATDDFNKTVGAKLLELYGVNQTIGGLTVKVLPPDLKPSVDAFLNR